MSSGAGDAEMAANDDKPHQQLDQESEKKGSDDGGDPKDGNGENPSPPSPEQEEQIIRSKYGGILPKKKPLISKDHERAFFDSADWALGKQGAKPKGPLEALRPKLQPTRQQQSRSRRSAYAHSNEDEDGTNPTSAADDETGSQSVGGETAEEQSHVQ
ncbi:hypothetical protein LINGRAHAP2_LOCUS33650 [Linum grandiflorum]